MKSLSKSILLAAFLLAGVAAGSQAATVGYTNGTVNRSKTFRLGNTLTQGMAFYLDAEKAQQLKGATVKSFITHAGTQQASNVQFFITKELGGTASYSQSFTPGSAMRAKEFALTLAYVMDGEPCYVGWSMDANLSYPCLSFDLSSDYPAGICWAYVDGEWTDVSAAGYGAPNIQLVVEGSTATVDMVAKPLQTEGYQKAGTPEVFSGQLFNYGTETVTSFDITCRLGNAEPVVLPVKGLSLKSGSTYDYTLPEYLTAESGELDLEVTVSNVNGVADADNTDNSATSSTYFYPANVERKVLVEVFTGQTCGNCPSGHTALANALKGREDQFIEVAHHAGYFPDNFSMKESWEYVYLYGTTGSYAPAATFNRMQTALDDPNKPTVVFQSNVLSNCNIAVQTTLNVQPYVGIDMYNEFDETTRKGSVAIDVTTYVTPSDSIHALNVWIVQDGLVGYQANGGSEYVHNHVFCKALTNSAWGQQILLEPGTTVRRTFQYEIPEEMPVTYYHDSLGVTMPAIPANMQLVAFVGDVSATNPMACNVYNADKIEMLTNNMAEGIEEMETVQPEAAVSVNGNTVTLLCEHTGAEVYGITGTEAARVNAGEQSFTLPAGIYLVRVRQINGAVAVCKLVVR